jgi:hypothetical protein
MCLDGLVKTTKKQLREWLEMEGGATRTSGNGVKHYAFVPGAVTLR